MTFNKTKVALLLAAFSVGGTAFAAITQQEVEQLRKDITGANERALELSIKVEEQEKEIAKTKNTIDQRSTQALNAIGLNTDEIRDLKQKKADKSELAKKADKADLATKADKSELAKKADKTELATKADKSELAAKADKTELAAKADKSELAAKADKTELATKADKTELATKADKKDLTALNTQISNLSGATSRLNKLVAANEARLNQLDARLTEVQKEVRRGLAAQAALAGLFQPYGVGKVNITAGIGGYKSSSAIAVGTGYRFNEKFAAKAGLALTAGNRSTSYNVTVNYEF